MLQLTKPHDEFFKETFRDRHRAQAYFQQFLPAWLSAKLDFRRMKLVNIAFNDEVLRERFADVIYSCPYEGKKREVLLTLLLEHKTGYIAFPFPQLMQYISGHWEQQMKQKKKGQEALAVVVPILFVQGPHHFAYKPIDTYFEDLDEELLPFLPRFQYLVMNLPSTPISEILQVKDSVLQVSLMVMKEIWHESRLLERARDIFKPLRNIEPSDQKRAYLRSLFVYLFSHSSLNNQQKQDIIYSIPETLKADAMNTLERIYHEGKLEGKLEGISEGETKGEIRGKKALIRQVLLHGYTAEQAVSLLAVPLSLVEEVMREMRSELPN